jgi:hypothetical protein
MGATFDTDTEIQYFRKFADTENQYFESVFVFLNQFLDSEKKSSTKKIDLQTVMLFVFFSVKSYTESVKNLFFSGSPPGSPNGALPHTLPGPWWPMHPGLSVFGNFLSSTHVLLIV